MTVSAQKTSIYLQWEPETIEAAASFVLRPYLYYLYYTVLFHHNIDPKNKSDFLPPQTSN